MYGQNKHFRNLLQALIAFLDHTIILLLLIVVPDKNVRLISPSAKLLISCISLEILRPGQLMDSDLVWICQMSNTSSKLKRS